MMDHAQVARRDGASFSACERWRYTLRRSWEGGTGEIAWVCLNPSTADWTENDPTVERTISWAKRWGFAATWMLNAYAWRDTDPRQLRINAARGIDVVGADNDSAILSVVQSVDRVILAWGNHAQFLDRSAALRRLLTPYLPKCYRLGTLTKPGEPRHPLYLPNSIAVNSFAD